MQMAIHNLRNIFAGSIFKLMINTSQLSYKNIQYNSKPLSHWLCVLFQRLSGSHRITNVASSRRPLLWTWTSTSCWSGSCVTSRNSWPQSERTSRRTGSIPSPSQPRGGRGHPSGRCPHSATFSSRRVGVTARNVMSRRPRSWRRQSLVSYLCSSCSIFI